MSLLSLFRKKNNKILFTTPSHDQKLCIIHKLYQWYKMDISEVEAYNPEEELKKAEEKATNIYQTKSTKFLTNGSSSGIIAAVLSCSPKGDKILIWNKSHPCHKNACLLAGATKIEYQLRYNKEWGIYEPLQPIEVEELLNKYKPKAIIITSPTYEGLVSDIKSIKEICSKYGTYLIVDEAHGALYPFSKELPESATQIADYTIQSLHKTAGGINPTALLHCNCDANINESLKLITTTSPSYPMLASIEANINFLNSKKGKAQITELTKNIKALKKSIKHLEFYGDDITKILIKHPKLNGYDFSELLYNTYNIEDERTNEISTMLLTGLGTSDKKLLKLQRTLSKIDRTIL